MRKLALLTLLFGLATGTAGAATLKINFQSNGAPIPAGYLPDYGEAFGNRAFCIRRFREDFANMNRYVSNRISRGVPVGS